MEKTEAQLLALGWDGVDQSSVGIPRLASMASASVMFMERKAEGKRE
jgi:hypothetical protein